MLKLLAKLFGAKNTAPAEPEAPYKVEAPAPAPTPVAEQAAQAVVESIAPAKKTGAPKQGAAKKPRKPKSKPQA